jgi:hypothetical protein
MSWIRLPYKWADQLGARRLARLLVKDGVPRRTATQFARNALKQANETGATVARLERGGDLAGATEVRANFAARLEAETASLPRDAAREPFDWGEMLLSILLFFFKIAWFVVAGFFILCFYLARVIFQFVLTLFGFGGRGRTVSLPHLDLLFLRGRLG